MLRVNNLSTFFKSKTGFIKAVDDISFEIKSNKTLAIIGESGCGKSITGLSLMRLLPNIAAHSNDSQVVLEDKDVLNLQEQEMRALRGKNIAMIFQDPMTCLNPVLTIGEQIFEVLKYHGNFDKKELSREAIRLLKMVRIPDPEKRLLSFPFELSGGMRQRVMIAIAMALRPKVLIADEPTTALDVTTQAQIISLLKDLQSEVGTAIILITHDLGLAYQVADDIALMYAGHFVEYAKSKDFFTNPSHPYAIQLLQTIPSLDRKSERLNAIKGVVPKLDREFDLCKFLDRCEFSQDICKKKLPDLNEVYQEHYSRCHFYNLKNNDSSLSEERTRIKNKFTIVETDDKKEYIDESSRTTISDDSREIIENFTKNSVTINKADNSITEEHMHQTLIIDDSNALDVVEKQRHWSGASFALDVSNLNVKFPLNKSIFPWKRIFLDAVNNVSLKIKPGKTLALVGESGCGKSTLAKALLSLITDYSGKIVLLSKNTSMLNNNELNALRQDVQIIFQDPYSSLDPRMSIRSIILEGYKLHHPSTAPKDLESLAKNIILEVGLTEEALDKYPHEFSGGQRQRICIARALILQPKILVLDEPTSALDLSIQAQILNLLKDLQSNHNLTYLFITHNISVVEYMAHDVAVMYLGKIVEYGSVDTIISDPKHPYTRDLMSAVPKIGTNLEDIQNGLIKGEAPSVVNPPSGCTYHPRCKFAKDICKKAYPAVTYFGLNTYVTCYLYGEK